MRRISYGLGIFFALALVRCVGDDPTAGNATNGTPDGGSGDGTGGSSGGPADGSGGGDGGPQGGDAGGDADAAVVRTGAFRWFFGIPAASRIAHVVAKPNGNILAVGSLIGTSVTVGAGASQKTLTRIGYTDLIVVELDPNGALLWAQNYGQAGTGSYGASVTFSGTDVIVTGYYSDGTFLTMPDNGGGEANPFVLSIDSTAVDKSVKWKKYLLTQAGDFGSCSALSGVVSGRFAIACNIEGTLRLERDQQAPLSRGPISSAVVAVMTTAGFGVWETAITNTSPVYVGYDGTDVLYGAEYYDAANEVRSNRQTPINPAGFGRLLYWLTPTGSSWSRGFSNVSTNGNQRTAFGRDPAGNIVVAGSFRGTTDPGGGALTSVPTDAGAAAHDLYVVRFPSDGGAPLNQKRFGGPKDDVLFGLAIDPAGDIVFAAAADNVTFDSKYITPAPTNDGKLAIVKVGSTLDTVWAHGYPASTYIGLSNFSGAMAIGADHTVIVGGALPGYLELSATGIVNGTPPSNPNSFIAAFDR
jgi:hypothetical protein